MRHTPAPLPVAEPNHEAVAVIELFSERLNKLMDSAGFLSARDGRFSALGAKYGVSRQLAHRWCTGQALPAPHILLKIANDFHCSLDWLLGRSQDSSSGNIPIFVAKTSINGGDSWGFRHCGSITVFPHSAEMDRFVVVQNWCTCLEPDLSEGDGLLLRLGEGLEDGGVYIIQTTTGTIGVAKAKVLQNKEEVIFSRRIPPSTSFNLTFKIKDVSLNHHRQIDAVWRGGGILLVGKVVSFTRSLGSDMSPFFRAISKG